MNVRNILLVVVELSLLTSGRHGAVDREFVYIELGNLVPPKIIIIRFSSSRLSSTSFFVFFVLTCNRVLPGFVWDPLEPPGGTKMRPSGTKMVPRCDQESLQGLAKASQEYPRLPPDYPTGSQRLPRGPQSKKVKKINIRLEGEIDFWSKYAWH